MAPQNQINIVANDALMAHPVMKNTRRKALLLAILKELNHPTRAEVIKTDLVIVHTGQIVRTMAQWSEVLNENPDPVKLMFKYLEEQRFIFVDLVNNVSRVTLMASPYFSMELNPSATGQEQIQLDQAVLNHRLMKAVKYSKITKIRQPKRARKAEVEGKVSSSNLVVAPQAPEPVAAPITAPNTKRPVTHSLDSLIGANIK